MSDLRWYKGQLQYRIKETGNTPSGWAYVPQAKEDKSLAQKLKEAYMLSSLHCDSMLLWEQLAQVAREELK